VSEPAATWKFPTVFWTANLVELFERAAYYGTFIALQVFLTQVAGFSDIAAGWIGACFAGGIYLFPLFTGAAADRLGFRPSLALAFALLAAGYALLGLVPRQGVVVFSLFLIAFGGSFVKPIITGTVSLCSDAASRARAFSLFYMIVNIGSFSGKTIAGPVRKVLGVGSVPLYSAGAALIALVIVVAAYRPAAGARSARVASRRRRAVPARDGERAAHLADPDHGGVLDPQGQMYASMPKYVLRWWARATSGGYANVNPLVVVLLVVPITQLARRLRPVTSMRRPAPDPALGARDVVLVVRARRRRVGERRAPAARDAGHDLRHRAPGSRRVLPEPALPRVRLEAGAPGSGRARDGLRLPQRVLRVVRGLRAVGVSPRCVLPRSQDALRGRPGATPGRARG
jgi:MFS family permease